MKKQKNKNIVFGVGEKKNNYSTRSDKGTCFLDIFILFVLNLKDKN